MTRDLFAASDPRPPQDDRTVLAQWTNLERTLSLRAGWTQTLAILLVAHDDSAIATARAICRHLHGAVLEIPKASPNRDWWAAHVKPLADGSLSEEMLRSVNRERVCILIDDLDRRPEWLVRSVRHLLEGAKRPVSLIATAREDDAIPRDVRSFLSTCRKIGRPREGEPQPRPVNSPTPPR